MTKLYTIPLSPPAVAARLLPAYPDQLVPPVVPEAWLAPPRKRPEEGGPLR